LQPVDGAYIYWQMPGRKIKFNFFEVVQKRLFFE
jgi:hypothetical protein